ncbi:hypothetical protein [Pelistega ratti]|uniref:hypothetical protein n=1 Tax=Pelistega ratti TaxID=2652177 RepID=UPI0013573D28|nr:hypothetical protein [Pelistega ratti]
MNLYEIIKNIDNYNVEDTIFSEEPWNIYSPSIVIHEDENKPSTYVHKKYFLEIFLVKELLDDLPKELSLEEKCNRIIHYAINDS